MNSSSPQYRSWHALDTSVVLQEIGVSEQGLRGDAAKERQAKFGPNALPERKPPALWQIILRQFRSPLIYILALAAVVSLFIGDLKDAAFIGVVLLINAAIGAWQEWKAESSSQALRKMLQIRATVLRDGEAQEIPAEEVVPGDVVLLESGNRTPADLRLLSAHDLEIDESLLTGESLPVSKEPGRTVGEDAPLGDRRNMAFAGSIVTRGRGKGLAVATGNVTQVGLLAKDVEGASGGNPPLVARMERFSNVVAVGTLVAATAIGGLALALGRYAPQEIFMFVIALAVSAIPEGLPVAMTVALAIATTRMARRGVIVRRLAAVEGLGSCTLIATDKTGTLTVNELTVKQVRLPDGETVSVTGEGFDPTGDALADGRAIEPRRDSLKRLIRAGMLCNDADLHRSDEGWRHRGDAVDIALLALGRKLGWTREEFQDAFPQVNEIPFESERQYAATYHRAGEQGLVLVKGAPERVLAMCEPCLGAEPPEAVAMRMAAEGYRVLALAEGVADATVDSVHAPPEPSKLVLLGFVGMIDPLRAGVREAVAACRGAGIDVAMVTGDHRVTALKIASELGLATDESETLDGAELAKLEPEQLQEAIGRVRVFARVAPRQKLQIVEAAMASGRYVAVTGDGVNDAPALRAANIGVAMGKSGTDVAREASELVISDDDFSSIVAGVEEGRVAYDNIRKVIYLLLSTGAAELLMVLLTVAFGLPIPLLPVQLLWLNLVTNGIQGVAIAFEPGEGDSLRRKPRSPREPIFNQMMLERLAIGVLTIGGVGFGAFYWMIANGWEEQSARNVLLLLMVLFENFHIGNCRSETKSAFVLSPLRSPILLFGTLAAFLVHVAAMYVPLLQDALRTSPVSLYVWAAIIPLAVSVVPAIELHKLYLRLSGRV